MDRVQWWVLALETGMLVWARMQELESGITEVLDSSGLTIRFDDWDNARHSLLDLNYRAYDGLDHQDAYLMGFDLDDAIVPDATDEESLVLQMTQPIVSTNQEH